MYYYTLLFTSIFIGKFNLAWLTRCALHNTLLFIDRMHKIWKKVIWKFSERARVSDHTQL